MNQDELKFIAENVAQLTVNNYLVQIIERKGKELVYHTAYFKVPEGAVNKPNVIWADAEQALRMLLEDLV